MATQSYPAASTAPVAPATPTSRLVGGRFGDLALLALRVMAGLMFAQHGAQKLFGWFADPSRPAGGTPPLFSMMGLAGVLEFFGGLLVAFGLFTRPVAFVLAGQMAVAYFMAHLPQGFWPIMNRGELSALYCFVFLLLAALGPGAYSLDAVLRRRR